MDLNGRVDQLDEEMKLLKNEIKQVLLQIQEHVLNAQNPFGGVLAMAGRGQVPATVAAPTPAPGAAPTPAPIPSLPGAQAMPMGATGGITTTSPSNLGEPAIGPGEDSMPSGNAGATVEPLDTPKLEVPQPTEAVSSVLSDDDDDSGPALGPELEGEFDDDSGMASSSENSHPPISARPKPIASTRRASEKRRDRTQLPRKESRLATQEEGEPDQSDSQPNPDDPGLWDSIGLAPNQENGIDLITIAGLAQWCDRALEKISKDNFEILINVAEMTGRVTKETRDIILALVPLFENPSFKEKEEVSISAKDIVTLLAQLDGLLAGGPMTDSRLLPFLLQQ